ncbi:LPXTG-motif cell wall-anchored protein [Microbacterium sp. SLBN-154]|uniref:LPXTG cell wall anchor domain-containing protein n=1 Tax=Microbacterium sp. SLBN-154 TaxID=2768458 RepID=UPI00114E57A3|nr:LPXTG cell wall anchor domain-containing protein [Microbacterium sp. SLBN-154]TQK20459.1 LPXTG-motif cell wall-anchored protein [Microbacterium sp. SLBN-154]
MTKKLLAALAAVVLVAFGAAAPAHADAEPSLTASPTSITLGGSSELTLTGVDEGVQVNFAIAQPELPNNGGMLNPESATVADGQATVVFTPNAAATYVIEAFVQNSESPAVASVTIEVSAAMTPELTASPASLTLGGSSVLTLTGVEDGVEAIFSIAEPALPNNQGMLVPEVATVADGQARVTFTPNAVGTYAIEVFARNSEGPALATVTIAVSAATTPTQSPRPLPSVLPATGADETSGLALLGGGVLIAGLGLVLVAASVTRARRS